MLSKLILGLYVLTTASALVLMKLGSKSGAPVSFVGSKLAFNLNWVILLGGVLYIVSFALYTFLISKYSLGYIIPLSTGLVYVLIFFASFIVFNETFTILKLLAIAFILGGVALLNVKP